MKIIHLTNGYESMVDDEDFERLTTHKWKAQKGHKTMYAVRNRWGNKKYIVQAMHRIIMGLSDPKLFVDHRDGNGLNNQKYNLRIATKSQNNANRTAKKGGTSKYLGVCRIKNTNNKFQANIRKDNKKYGLGYFHTEEAAALAYNKAATRLHGEFAKLNII